MSLVNSICQSTNTLNIILLSFILCFHHTHANTYRPASLIIIVTHIVQCQAIFTHQLFTVFKSVNVTEWIQDLTVQNNPRNAMHLCMVHTHSGSQQHNTMLTMLKENLLQSAIFIFRDIQWVNHHLCVAGEGHCITPVPWGWRMADLHNVDGMLPCYDEPDRPICCLVNQDAVSVLTRQATKW